jgi:hypothetical protein
MNPPCGTPAGYVAHLKAGHKPDTRCCDANADYKRTNRIAAGKQDHVQIPVWLLAQLLRSASPEHIAMTVASLGPRTVAAVRRTAQPLRDQAVAS